MLKSEKQKLEARANEYLSIGITETGEPRGIISVPWEKTAHAHNMKLPDVYITPDDLNDDELLKTLHGYRVIGCYIYAPLDSYDFLSSFTELRDLYITKAENLTSLDFAKDLRECDMLVLEGARLDNLDVICDIKKSVKGIFGGFRCLALFDCEIEDLSTLSEVSFSELIVSAKGEEMRWRKIPAHTFRYYEL